MKILVLTESHHLSTGYANLSRSLLPRLAREGFEIFELASGGHHDEPGVPWKYRPVTPRPGDENELRWYNSDPHNQFGSWKFEQACLDFRPDIVWTMRDAWMDACAFESPYRDFYRLVAQTPVDAAPQHEEWLDQFTLADELYTYTDWGHHSLLEQSPLLPLKGSVYLGVDTNLFTPPVSTLAHRQQVGLEEDALIIGTVMRNMVRKLYPDLIKGFARLLKEGPEEITRRCYLYIHACWPDSGWDLPRLAREAGVSSRVLFTYVCANCGRIYPSFFSGALSACRRCGALAARLPHPLRGLPHENLPDIYRLFDLYVQLACAEGCGLSQIEAAACGVPGVCLDYAGMADMVHTLGFLPVSVKGYWTERETGRQMAVPDMDSLVANLLTLLREPAPMRATRGIKARKGVEQHYSWDGLASRWKDIFLSQGAAKLSWDAPSRYTPRQQLVPPEGLTNEEFVDWGIINLLKMPHLRGTKKASLWARDLSWETTFRAGWNTPREFNRSTIMEEWKAMASKFDFWEQRRASR